MSSRKIRQLLTKKGIEVKTIEYQRGCPVPEGYVNGYSLWFDEEVEEAVFELKPELGVLETYMEFDTAEDVYKWIETLPSLK